MKLLMQPLIAVSIVTALDNAAIFVILTDLILAVLSDNSVVCNAKFKLIRFLLEFSSVSMTALVSEAQSLFHVHGTYRVRVPRRY